MSDQTAVIVAARRTPIGRFLGGFTRMPATDLGAFAIRAVLDDVPAIKDQLDELIMGHVLQAGAGQNPARQAGLKAGLGNDLIAMTVNKVCGSSIKTTALAAQAIKAGDGQCYIAGGMENMSRAPHLADVRSGVKFGDFTLVDHMRLDGLHCAMSDQGMGLLAEYIAGRFDISRQEQDRYSAQSHLRAAKAAEQGWYRQEIVPVPAEAAQAKQDITGDEGVRPDTSPDGLAKLRPAFDKNGSVTAGNASQISDGAAAMVVMSLAKAEKLGLEPLVRIVSYHAHGVEPKELFAAPVGAIRGVVDKAGLALQDVDLFELNEAFAAQTLANLKELELSQEKVNVAGGAIAIGHPIGASGARIIVTLIHQLRRLDLKRGVAAACLGGGNAIALMVERI